MRILWQKSASKDLALIFKFIEKESPQNALLVFNSICDLVISLEIFPYKYPKERSFNSENIRYAVVWSFKIVYSIEEENIVILRVFNTKQNPKKLKK
ncbi:MULTISPECIES: type II toxin-antitoxin system RelE/ParE family toxin [unclassified Flavobacterium]|jgi:plasmid stabilization system protein ParE|uniref:type II toxin-antitoxin system RelE/ParE family toxin n=1 Tax=unclassified Flavobacterium TaxID=196869 RepID=UPI0025C1042C|nr:MULTISPECIES: type II toxin-antitoxin system RelE/ParE family toxin [unclassified Flavobacterium]